MAPKKNKKNWYPDPQIARLIKPFFDQGYFALATHIRLMREERLGTIKNPSIKTYLEYWRYWREQAVREIKKKIIVDAIRRSKKYEKHYLLSYDRLILVTNEMLEMLENLRDPKQKHLHHNSQNCTFTNPNEIELDINLENLILKIIRHFVKVYETKHETENEIILLKIDKRKLDRRLYKITIQTHSKLLRVVNYLAKREAKQVTLDCQIKDKMEGKIVIRCGICATKVLQVLIHKTQAY